EVALRILVDHRQLVRWVLEADVARDVVALGDLPAVLGAHLVVRRRTDRRHGFSFPGLVLGTLARVAVPGELAAARPGGELDEPRDARLAARQHARVAVAAPGDDDRPAAAEH